MIHNLTREEYLTLWQNHHSAHSFHPGDRIDVWNEVFKPMFKLEYDELDTDDDEVGYWGQLSGDEKYINFFLIHDLYDLSSKY